MEPLAQILAAGGIATGAFVLCIVAATVVALLARSDRRRRDARQVLAMLLFRPVDQEQPRRSPRSRSGTGTD